VTTRRTKTRVGISGESQTPAGSAPIPTLETARLLLKPAGLADAPQLQEIFPRWEIVKYLAAKVPWPYPENGAETFLREIALPAMQRGDMFLWMMRRKPEPERIIGAINLAPKSQDENRGFWIEPKWQGQGLMSEACDAVTEYWFEVLKKPVLRAPKAIANEGSRRISERQGMRVVWRGERDYVSGKLPSEIWEITAEEWRTRKTLVR
jgi:[ribosomal protein S5]-alanine N-acetyltransferase